MVLESLRVISRPSHIFGAAIRGDCGRDAEGETHRYGHAQTRLLVLDVACDLTCLLLAYLQVMSKDNEKNMSLRKLFK